MRKTDDEIIIKMLNEGRLQIDIAKHFGVSPAYICKRLKKISLNTPPESFQQLTLKEQQFVIERVKGNTATQSVMNSYEVGSRESAKAIGNKLSKKPAIQESITTLLEMHGAGLSHRVRRLSEHIDNRDANVSLKALDQSWKLGGDYTPQDSGGNTQSFGTVIVNNFHQPVQIVSKSDKNGD